MTQGFSRLCAINGGTFMLDHTVDEVLFNDKGEAWGIRHGSEYAKAKVVIGDPSYFPKAKVGCLCIGCVFYVRTLVTPFEHDFN